MRIYSKMHAPKLAVSLTLMAGLVACASFGPSKATLSYKPIDSFKLTTPIGTFEVDFGKEAQQIVNSADKLGQKGATASADSLSFHRFEFNTGPLPAGCKPFGSPGRYGNLIFPKDGAAVSKIRDSVEAMKKQYGYAPDEAVVALAIYEATAFRSLCDSTTMAKLKSGSSINGWKLNDAAVKLFGEKGQGEIDVTPSITIVALKKSEFEGHVKPTAANVLLSKYRYEVPPDSDSLVSDPNTGAAVLAYSLDLKDILLGDATRDVLAGGVLRVFVGKTYIYLIDFYTNTEGVPQKQLDAYKKYIDSFEYVGKKVDD